MPDFESILEEDPVRMMMVNLASETRIEAMFNPENLEESLGVTYAKQKIPGLSHTRKQFSNTEDLVETFTLFWSANGGDRGSTSPEGAVADQRTLLETRRILMSWCYPRNATSLVEGAGAPRVLFIWPGWISLTCVITSLRFKYPKVSKAGPPLIMAVDVTLEEIRDRLILSEEVADVGTERP